MKASLLPLAKRSKLVPQCPIRSRSSGRRRVQVVVVLFYFAALFCLFPPVVAANPLAQGLAAVDQGRAGEARASLLLLEGLDRSLLEWHLLTRNPDAADFEALSSFLLRHAGWPKEGLLQRAAESKLPQELPEDELLRWFGAFPPITAQAALAYVRILEGRGELEAAAAVARRSWRDLGPDAAADDTLLKRFGGALLPVDHRARLDRLLRNGKAKAALESLAQARAAGAIAVDQHRVLEARARLHLLQPEGERLAAALATETLRQSGLVLDLVAYRMRRSPTYDPADLLDPPPVVLGREAADRWPVVRQAVQRLLAQHKEDAAYRLAAAHGMSEGPAFDEAEFMAGWLALQRDDPERAYAHFDRLFHHGSGSDSIARGAYWCGQAAAAMGREDWATQWHDVAAQHDSVFYGLMAALQSGSVDRQQEEPPRLLEVGLNARLAFEQRDLVRAIRRLHEVGRSDLLPPFFETIREGGLDGERYRLLGEVARAVGREDEVIRNARSALSAGWSFPDLLYPLPQLDLPADEKKPLLLALIRQESGFNTHAVSQAGALGLMQLMPGTAREVAAVLGEPYDPGRLTADPAYNLRLGRAYLDAMLARYGGVLPLALAAYNAGPGRVDAWLKDFGDPRQGKIGLLDWIELIPFDETRHYVHAVIEVAAIYARRLQPEKGPSYAEFSFTPTALLRAP